MGKETYKAKSGNPLEDPNPETQKVALKGCLLTLFLPNLSHPTERKEAQPARALEYPTLPSLSAPTNGSFMAESARLHPKRITNPLKRKILQTSKVNFIQKRKVQNS